MKIIDIANLPHFETDDVFDYICGCSRLNEYLPYYDFWANNYFNLDNVDKEKKKNIDWEFRVHGRRIEDHRRAHVVASFWFKDKPVFVCQLAGREYDDYVEMWMIDVELFSEFKKVVDDMFDVDSPDCDVIDEPDAEIENIFEFYGETLLQGKMTERVY